MCGCPAWLTALVLAFVLCLQDQVSKCEQKYQKELQSIDRLSVCT